MTPTAADLTSLAKYDTPTICNALEIAVPARRGHGYTVKPLVAPFPNLPPIVGFARTATIRAMLPNAEPAEAAREKRMRYYRDIAAAPGPSIAVLQDIDAIPGYGAFWGEVQSNVHKGLGCAGVITDGSIRDIPAWAPGFFALAGSIGPSHAHVHLVEIGGEITVAGMRVRPGDLIHADSHGAVIVPTDAIAAVLAAADLCMRKEAPILAAARAPGFSIEHLARAFKQSDEIH